MPWPRCRRRHGARPAAACWRVCWVPGTRRWCSISAPACAPRPIAGTTRNTRTNAWAGPPAGWWTARRYGFRVTAPVEPCCHGRPPSCPPTWSAWTRCRTPGAYRWRCSTAIPWLRWRWTAAARPGPLDGRFVARFVNGNRLAFTSRGEVSLLNGAPPRLEARLGINDYVARVLEREAAARPLAAARALAVAARSYLMQQARREGACLVLPDSSASQRVSSSPAGVAAREVAAWTDSLVLTGVLVQSHLEEAGPHRLACRQAVAWAQDGAGFEEILARAYPGAALASTESPLATDCQRLPEAERWVASQARRWRPRLIAEAGYETPLPPAVCRLDQGNPYADPARGRIYARGLTGREGRLTLAHEYLHLAFARHPAGQDEAWIETLARRLLLEGAP